MPGPACGRIALELRRAYELMRARFGHQHWWPGETPFEVCVGAILTQNTAWSNVERAIAHLKAAQVLEPARLHALPETGLAELIRPAGYFNVKARRLRAFLRTLVGDYGGELRRLFAGETSAVRDRLLAINGVGPETADSMLLYAGRHHSFVIDAYTRRIFARHRWCVPDASYDDLKALCEASLSGSPVSSRSDRPPGAGNKSAAEGEAGNARLDLWQDYHAQLVKIGKHFCRPRDPRCADCPLNVLLPETGPAGN